MHLLVTGGAGFIGSHFIHYILQKYPRYKILNVDCLTYAGNEANVSKLKQTSNYQFIKGNITDPKLLNALASNYKIDMIINFAAESDVDRSIADSMRFIETNINGTHALLNMAKKYRIPFLQISTDEVYGSIQKTGFFNEDSPLTPNNPYSASKASADLLTLAYYKTFNLDVRITRSSNNYGPYQHVEKFIPKVITRAIRNGKIPIYGDGQQIRDWIHVKDHCAAIDLVIHKGSSGEVYNIGANNEWKNIDIAYHILNILGKPKDLIEFVTDRPGHDFRYGLNTMKMHKQLGWKPKISFEEGLLETITWYMQNKAWWKDFI